MFFISNLNVAWALIIFVFTSGVTSSSKSLICQTNWPWARSCSVGHLVLAHVQCPVLILAHAHCPVYFYVLLFCAHRGCLKWFHIGTSSIILDFIQTQCAIDTYFEQSACLIPYALRYFAHKFRANIGDTTWPSKTIDWCINWIGQILQISKTLCQHPQKHLTEIDEEC